MGDSGAKPIGERECRIFWQGILFHYPARRKLLARQWLLETLQKDSVKATCLADYFRHLLDTILFSPFDFRLHSDHCSLLGGLRVPFSILTESERAFVVACHAQRERLWRKIMCGRHGEVDMSGFVFNVEIQCYEARPPYLDKTWQRLMVREVCVSIASARWAELIVAVQRLLREKKDRFLIELDTHLQLGKVQEMPCWGYVASEAHPAVAYQKGVEASY